VTRLRAVLDANVYVSAAIRPDGVPGQLIECFAQGDFEIVMSPAVVNEVRRALGYRKVRKSVRTSVDLEEWFWAIVVLADLIEDRPPPLACEDPDDDKYLAAAIEGRAAFVVTGDQRFLALGNTKGSRS
jgi:uncharacterized protein